MVLINIFNQNLKRYSYLLKIGITTEFMLNFATLRSIVKGYIFINVSDLAYCVRKSISCPGCIKLIDVQGKGLTQEMLPVEYNAQSQISVKNKI